MAGLKVVYVTPDLSGNNLPESSSSTEANAVSERRGSSKKSVAEGAIFGGLRPNLMLASRASTQLRCTRARMTAILATGDQGTSL
jgi:hypothetical protein